MTSAEDYEARAATLQEDDAQWDAAMWEAPTLRQPQPPVGGRRPPAAAQQRCLVIDPRSTKIVFWGAGANSAYLNPERGIGPKRGPTCKAEYASIPVLVSKP